MYERKRRGVLCLLRLSAGKVTKLVFQNASMFLLTLTFIFQMVVYLYVFAPLLQELLFIEST